MFAIRIHMNDHHSTLLKHIYQEGLVTKEAFTWIHLSELSIIPYSGKGVEIT